MTANPYPRLKIHLAKHVSPKGDVSPACAKTPHPIDMQRATWTTDPSAVTCPRCRKVKA